MNLRAFQILRLYNENPALVDVARNSVALFVLGLLCETTPMDREQLKSEIGLTSEVQFQEAIDLLLSSQLIDVDEEFWGFYEVTPLGRSYLEEIGLLERRPPKKKEAIRALIVDDERLVCDVTRRILERHHLPNDAAYSAEMAIECLKKSRYDVVLLDIRMPGQSGFEVLEFIKRSLPDTRVIMMTGYGSRDNARKAFSLGATRFLLKPIAPKSLVSVLLQEAGSKG